MTQWNIELTFSTICIIASDAAASAAAQQERPAHSPKTYQWLCHLVATIIKRHRIRLGGHFHALITTLHSLLRWLLCQPPSPEGEERGANAKLFARLLTLVCEPTDASVPRSQATSLSSERDKAKRYAGQYMHLVLTQYIELQLHHTVSHEVREALDAGMYSVLDITPRDTLDVMNDALDRSGRVLFGELYKQYQRFGKWSGV
jgi:nucleolar pre-ribosomal-associated protein 2